MYDGSIIYCLFKHAVGGLDYAVQNNGMVVERNKAVRRSSKIVNKERESKNISVALCANIKECDIKYQQIRILGPTSKQRKSNTLKKSSNQFSVRDGEIPRPGKVPVTSPVLSV
jgi:hypothetical protein